MAKGSRTLNPADAHRKAERKKEIKKNKEARNKTREIVTVKKDTGGLEAEIRRLDEAGKTSDLDKHSKERLASLREEVERIKKKKAEYVTAHPEHEKLVYPGGSASRHGGDLGDRPPTAARNLFGPNGLPLHPERSIYYDEKMNPFGVPPPGMPYVERPLLPHELPRVEAQDSTHDDSTQSTDGTHLDDEIPLPPGPPPLPEESDDSDDDIPMPAGPPPGVEPGDVPSVKVTHSGLNLPVPSRLAPPLPPDVSQGFIPPPPPGFPPPPIMQFPPQAYPPFPLGVPFPPPPPGFPLLPQAPFGFAQPIPPPPQASPHVQPNQSKTLSPPYLTRPINNTALCAKAWFLPLPTPLPPTLAPSPLAAISPSPPTVATRFNQATISAEPELRDLKRESTAFVPTAVKRRKTGTVQRVNAAPAAGPDDATAEQPTVGPERPDLMAALRHAGVGGPNQGSAKDDYDTFLEELGDIL
ncbi:hypothetical protein BS47DRAFT_1373138 [Hydnum rufescens UP504]|uniref:Wbp11/ELF5/Saf1 N-terminal domain-containing protein n=1 Tax=Hydnum rufescens UP504 TaxID=1448309 RepID=A0A9P6DQK0_9AGAM|nr:hypothetical protein BS47DRAFT_1373138 [Hydnum rufescens UP504]